MATPIDGIQHTWTGNHRPGQPLGHKAPKAGLFEVQDASSQRLCESLPIETGTRVLDLCAGAGGKSLALATRGANVAATDIRAKALAELEKSPAGAVKHQTGDNPRWPKSCLLMRPVRVPGDFDAIRHCAGG